MRSVLVTAAASLALLGSGCASDTTAIEAPTAEAAAAAAAAPTAETTPAPLPGIKGAPQNGGGIVYHRSNCGYGYVRWYGAGGEGPAQACGTWSLAAYQRDIIHSFDWNFRTEDLTWLHLYYFNNYNNRATSESPWARQAEAEFFDAVNQINGGRGNSYTDLINVNLPVNYIDRLGGTTPGRGR
jgi:hypothetical protein